MASASGITGRQPDIKKQLIAGIHANCVFSDAEYPVKIDHLPGCAIVSPLGNKTGKIHFPLPAVLGQVEKDSQGGLSEEWLEVDFTQATQAKETKGGGAHIATTSFITKAEVYIGCGLYWSKDLQETTSFQVMLDKTAVALAAAGKGLEVTLTIQFGGDSLRFCSVTLFGEKLPGEPPRPE